MFWFSLGERVVGRNGPTRRVPEDSSFDRRLEAGRRLPPFKTEAFRGITGGTMLL
jgi:hypothetical protein